MPALRITMDVQGANAKNSTIVYGHPSPLAAIGFSHALCLKTGMEQKSGTIMVFHKYGDRGHSANGRFCYYMLRSANRDVPHKKGEKPQAQLDIPRSDMKVSLIFEVDNADRDDVRSTVPRMRFSGGMITGFREEVYETLSEAGSRCPRGFVMKEHDLPVDGDRIRALLDAISVKEKGTGWITPCLSGFRLLEDPRERKGAREGYLHAFADPLVGTVEFESVRHGTWQHYLWRIVRRGDLIIFRSKES